MTPSILEGSESALKRYRELLRSGNSFSLSIRQFALGRKFFASDSGRLGWVPAEARPGDKICFFHGWRIPFVIRSVLEGYELVGDCYLHGLMEERIAGAFGMDRETIILV